MSHSALIILTPLKAKENSLTNQELHSNPKFKPHISFISVNEFVVQQTGRFRVEQNRRRMNLYRVAAANSLKLVLFRIFSRIHKESMDEGLSNRYRIGLALIELKVLLYANISQLFSDLTRELHILKIDIVLMAPLLKNQTKSFQNKIFAENRFAKLNSPYSI